MEDHYAIIGMAHVEDGFPLYYDAVIKGGLLVKIPTGFSSTFSPEAIASTVIAPSLSAIIQLLCAGGRAV